MKIKIDSDRWEDVNKTWLVLEYKRRQNSTAVDLTLEDEYGIVNKRTVTVNEIEWIEE